MEEDKKISELSPLEACDGKELLVFAKNSDNGAVTTETMRKFMQNGVVKEEPGKGLSANDFTDELKADVEEWNEWREAQFTVVGRVDADGTISNFPQYFRTPLLPINRNYPINAYVGGHTSEYAITLFDKAGMFISGVRFTGATNIVLSEVDLPVEDIPENAVFYIVSTHMQRQKTSYYSNGPTLEAREGATASAIIESQNDEWKDTQFTVTGRFITLNGNERSQFNYGRTPLITLNRNHSIVVKAAVDEGVAVVAFYDSNAQFISGIPRSGTGTNLYTLNPDEFPETAAYFVVSSLQPPHAYGVYYLNGPTLEAREGAIAEAISASKKALFIDLWNAACESDGRYNGKTGYFELNGLTDITYTEAMMIMKAWMRFGIDATLGSNTVRTLFKVKSIKGGYDSNSFTLVVAFRFGDTLEALNLDVYTKSINWMCEGCTALKHIYGTIRLASGATTTNPFKGCLNLQSFNLYGLATSINIADSPLITLGSLRYMVTNAANTTAITVTVHPDVYAKLMDETNEEWHQLLLDATEKQIQFATT